ncbi:Thiol:disulfide interchange protein [Hahella chejuensis KCTC 2396]|uniref:Thiol:disulfide interchange protein DsbD n=1 Tax=Hahella chejuensis (strain KCTC 2396) TaxID=349521 RepID=Q2SJR7_HAHCH|nr:protein-disulfide reductase DsbD [Hahella chejuensis]ABC29107.1 Thiol:disulfide interchange protein [Hahella chejuensis KCTC 2396]
MPQLLRALFILTLFCCATVRAESNLFGDNNGFLAEPEFLPVEEAYRFTSSVEGDELVLHWAIADGYYLYKDRTSVTTDAEGVAQGRWTYSSPGEEKEDPYFGMVYVYHDELTIRVPVAAEEGAEVEFKVRYQGCAEAGLCYPPQTETALFTGTDSDSISPAATTNDSTQSPSPSTGQSGSSTSSSVPGPSKAADVDFTSSTSITDYLVAQGLLFSFFILMAVGIGLAFTPCVFPMVPILSSIIVGQKEVTMLHSFVLSLSYIMGMAAVYTALGAVAGHFGELGQDANIQAQVQKPWILITFSGLFVLLALSMFGFYELQMPSFLRDKLSGMNTKQQGGEIFSVFIMGLLSALVVSPCVSAPLIAALGYAAYLGSAFKGGVALFGLSLGIGLPLLILGTGGAKLLPRAGAWMEHVKHVFGVALLGVAIWMLERILPPEATLTLWAVLIGVSAVYMGAFTNVESGWSGWQKLNKGLGLVFFVYAVTLMLGAAAGANDPLRPLAPYAIKSAVAANGGPAAQALTFVKVTSPEQLDREVAQAAATGKPVMVDFYADWCISCKIMERETFVLPEVQSGLSRFHLVKADVTDNDQGNQALLKRYGIFGPPAFVFFNAQGKELESKRFLGEISKNALLNHVKDI